MSPFRIFDLPLHLQLLLFTFLFSHPTFCSSPLSFQLVKVAGFPLSSSPPLTKRTTLTNVTIDDSDAQSILYSVGQWTVTNSSNELDYGGYHHLSNQPTAFAIFNFTGAAVYFLSPLWPYSVGALLVLDGQQSAFVDLRDHSREESLTGGPETVATSVVWSMENLDEGEHSLRVEYPQGLADYVVLDGLIYSHNVETAIPESSTSPTSTSSLPVASAPTTVARQAPSPTNTTTRTTQSPTPIIIGVVLGTVLGIIVAVILVRCRGRISTRFPRLFPPENSGQGEIQINVEGGEVRSVEDRDIERSVISSSSVTHATALSTDRSGEQLLPNSNKGRSVGMLASPSSITRGPIKPSVRNASLVNTVGHSASKSTVALSPSSPTSFRPTLPPIITKQLPALPPTEEEETQNQSALKYGRSLISAVSRRLTLGQQGVGTNMSGSTSSASSSFFPKPIHDEDRGMVSMSRQQSLRGTAGTPTPASTELPELKSRAGTYPGYSEKTEGQEARLFPVRPVRPKVEEPTSSIDSGSKLQTVARPVSQTPSVSTRPLPTIVPTTTPIPSLPSAKKKPVNPLTIIPENSGSNSDVGSKEENSSPKSQRTSKRLSGGKIRLEKERHRRRRPKTPVTPQGPRPRPLPSLPPYSTPLSSASSFQTSTDSSSGTPKTPLSLYSQGIAVRKRRPLPQTSSESRRASLLPGSHILVPVKNIPQGLALGASQSLQIGALLGASSSSLSIPEKPPVSKPPVSEAVASPSTPLDNDDTLSRKESPPPISTQLPTLPPLPLLAPISALLPTTSSLAPLRPRSGQPEHSRSVPSYLPSKEPITPPSTSSTPRVPPTPPQSAASTVDTVSTGARSPRSPRRLPPEPLHLKNTNKDQPPSASFRDTSGAQYLTVSADFNLAPPPYSGRRSVESSSSKAPAPSSLKTPVQNLLARERITPAGARAENGQKEVSRTFKRQVPRSIPETPSEWRTSSAGQSVAATTASVLPEHREVNEVDETAAQMLFELLDEAGSRASVASSLASIRPLSFPQRASRAVSVPPPPRLPTVKTHNSAASVSGPSGSRDESIPPVPKLNLPPEARGPSLPRTPRLPPPPPRSPLTIPPHPTTPPPPAPAKPQRPAVRTKIWTPQGVKRARSSSSPTTNSSKFNVTNATSDVDKDNPSTYL